MNEFNNLVKPKALPLALVNLDIEEKEINYYKSLGFSEIEAYNLFNKNK